MSQTPEDFRKSISTVDSEGKRVWVYPRKPKGRYHNWRTIVAIILLAFLVGTPFIKMNGQPLLLFNILERRFIIFGATFWPQDFYLLALAFVTGIVGIILFTVVYGRIFCGWVCPQTIFMEMVFRKIEYLIEGDFNKQKALDKMPWNSEKLFKKGLKHFIFFALAFGISNIFLAYIIGVDELYTIITDPPEKHIVGLVAILVFSGVFYWIFTWFREQVCIIACPYGRLQGAMLDKNSLVVAYDYIRGEIRGKFRKKEVRTEGDCIDCHQCVQVCPTGIDIRNGTQLECINCTACMDACDSIMDRVGFDRGLIRYASEDGIAKREPFKWTPRVISYTVVLFGLVALLSSLIATRSDIETTMLQARGNLYRKTEAGIRNHYTITLINKTVEEIPAELKLENVEKGTIEIVGGDLTVPRQGKVSRTVIIIIPRESLSGMITQLNIGVYNSASGERISTEKVKFLGPQSRK